MKENKKIYDMYTCKVEKFLIQLDKINPDWIYGKEWNNELTEFKLGQNAVKTLLVAETNKHAELCESFKKTAEIVGATCQEKIHEFGLAIIPGTNDSEHETHQKTLDFVWWEQIYTRGKNVGIFSYVQIQNLNWIRQSFSKKDPEIFG